MKGRLWKRGTHLVWSQNNSQHATHVVSAAPSLPCHVPSPPHVDRHPPSCGTPSCNIRPLHDTSTPAMSTDTTATPAHHTFITHDNATSQLPNVDNHTNIESLNHTHQHLINTHGCLTAQCHFQHPTPILVADASSCLHLQTTYTTQSASTSTSVVLFSEHPMQPWHFSPVIMEDSIKDSGHHGP